MLDFVNVIVEDSKNGTIVYPDFIVTDSKDLMIRGRAFYAVWDERIGFWSTDENLVQVLVDQMVKEAADEIPGRKKIKYMRNFSTNKWQEWKQYCKSLPDNYHELDKKIIFSNEEVKKEDYATTRLPYPIKEQETPSYDRLMDVLYSPEEREKLEWAIGAIISGDSKEIQKFIVLYGAPGTGKSTILNIIQEMFPCYYSVFDARSIGSDGSFGLESLKDNPLIGIQHDGDLSRIEDNTKLNSIIAHEKMVVNEKFKSIYTTRFCSFLMMGTNKPVRITDAKSGLIRRLIDVNPTGDTIPPREFHSLMKKIRFEHSGIAKHCLDRYKTMGRSYYNDYVSMSMIGATNDVFAFIEDNYDIFAEVGEDGITLSTIWKLYKEYCEEARVGYPLKMRALKVEMKAYFKDFKERWDNQYSIYFGFLTEKFSYGGYEGVVEESFEEIPEWLRLRCDIPSEFDDIFGDCPAQYATEQETPMKSWDHVKTKLSEIDTRKLHYVRPPENVVVIDFDLKNEKGEKDLKKNLEEVSKWPATYMELSKGGAGVHLHYYYEGDILELKRIYDENVEIKVFTGKSSLRRKLSSCNEYPIATIRSGLPLKERKKDMLNNQIMKSEKSIRNLIIKNLRKEIHSNTKPSIDFIYKILNDAYESGMHYDVRDMAPDIQAFAFDSSHNSDYCMRLVSKMKFASEDLNNERGFEDAVEILSPDTTNKISEVYPILFYDVEVFPNLFVVCCKKAGPEATIMNFINPTPSDIEKLCKYRLIGFNNRKYDNHILYARMMGYNNEQLYLLSQRIISGDRDAFFGGAYNLSYTDVYDFLSAANKMSLKKWEIKLGIHHQELPIPWNQPVPKERWEEVVEYCGYDVLATEAVFDANPEDWKAREILAEWSGLTVNDTTNACTAKIIVGDDKNPQEKFIYTDLSTIFPGYEFNEFGIDPSKYKEGAKIVTGKSLYMGEDPGEGGRVFARPGIYYDVALLDGASMHPHSIITLEIFGKEYTMRYADIVDTRLFIKHGEYDRAKELLPEELHKYLNDPEGAAALSTAMKTPLNSAYGLTSAKFPNKLRDPRNKDNIVAKYGALFMMNLQKEVEDQGFIVAHVKTDSIKIPNATPEIIEFVMNYAKEYGYTFEHEATYERMCLVNEAVYIAKYDKPKKDKKTGNDIWWTATGTQFQIPYVFKTLFSKEPIEFKDLFETFSVSTAMYLDMDEGLYEGNHDYRFVGKVGAFCPIKPGKGGGRLLRIKKSDTPMDNLTEDSFGAVTGTKKKKVVFPNEVWRWLETEVVKVLEKEDDIDRAFYDEKVTEAIETIEQFGDFEMFVSGERVVDNSWVNIPDDILEDEVPFDEFPMNAPFK